MAATTTTTATANPAVALLWSIVGFKMPAYLVGTWVGAGLTGWVVCEAIACATKSHHSRRVRATALALAVLSLFSAAMEFTGSYVMVRLILNRTPSPNLLLPQADGGIIFATAFSGVLSGCYFGHLIFNMFGQLFPTRRWIRYLWLVVFGLILASAACSSLWLSIQIARIYQYWIPQLAAVNLRGTPINIYILWLSSAAVVDVTLAVILTGRFLKDIRRDGFTQTNSVLIRLVVSTLETFSLTALLAIANAALASYFNRVPYKTASKIDAALYVMNLVIGRTYALSFLSAQKRRAAIQESHRTTATGVAPTWATNTAASGLHHPSQASSTLSRGAMGTHHSVLVERTTAIRFDSHRSQLEDEEKEGYPVLQLPTHVA